MKTQETKGMVKQVTGRLKEAVGVVTGNEKLEREGSAQRAEGAVQESVGKLHRKVGELADDLARAIKK